MGRTIGFHNIRNARDLGGLTGLDGKKIKHNLLIRTGNLAYADKHDISVLKDDCNLKTIIDLRSYDESIRAPDPEIDGVSYFHIPVLDDSRDDPLARAIKSGASTRDNYVEILVNLAKGKAISEDIYIEMLSTEHSWNSSRRFLEMVAENENGSVLWHCTSGKDRTGIGAALVLKILGVSDKDIFEDYMETNMSNSALIKRVSEESLEFTDDPAVLEDVVNIVGVNLRFMQKFFEHMESECGSVIDFIKKNLGVSDSTIDTMREKYLE